MIQFHSASKSSLCKKSQLRDYELIKLFIVSINFGLFSSYLPLLAPDACWGLVLISIVSCYKMPQKGDCGGDVLGWTGKSIQICKEDNNRSAFRFQKKTLRFQSWIPSWILLINGIVQYPAITSADKEIRCHPTGLTVEYCTPLQSTAGTHIHTVRIASKTWERQAMLSREPCAEQILFHNWIFVWRHSRVINVFQSKAAIISEINIGTVKSPLSSMKKMSK